MASNPPIEAIPRSEANPHARITAYVLQQRAFLHEYRVKGREYIDRYLARDEDARQAEQASLQAGLSEAGPSSEPSRHSSSLRRPGVAARMQPRQSAGNVGGKPIDISRESKRRRVEDTRNDLEASKRDSKVNKKSHQRGKDKAEVDESKRKTDKSGGHAVLQETTRSNVEPVKGDGSKKGQRASHKEPKAPKQVVDDSEPDRAARLEARKMRRRDKAATMKPKEPEVEKKKEDSKRKRDRRDPIVAPDPAASSDDAQSDEDTKTAKKKRKKPAKVEKDMAMLAAFEANNIGGTNGRITVNPLRKGGLFGRRISSTRKTIPLTSAARKARKPVTDLPDEPVKLWNRASRRKPDSSSTSRSDGEEADREADGTKEVSDLSSSESSRCKVRKTADKGKKDKANSPGGARDNLSEKQACPSEDGRSPPASRRKTARLQGQSSLLPHSLVRAQSQSWPFSAPINKDAPARSIARSPSLLGAQTQLPRSPDAALDKRRGPAPQDADSRMHHEASLFDALEEVQRLLGKGGPLEAYQQPDATWQAGDEPRCSARRSIRSAGQEPLTPRDRVEGGATSRRRSTRRSKRSTHQGHLDPHEWTHDSWLYVQQDPAPFEPIPQLDHHQQPYAGEPPSEMQDAAHSRDPLEIFGTRTETVQRRLYQRRSR